MERQRRRERLEKYLQQHNVPTIIEALVTGLCVERPDVPRDYLIEGLKEIRETHMAITWCAGRWG